jgi:fumarate hydratase class II
MLIRNLRNERRKKIAELTSLPFKSHPNKFAALSAHDEMVFCSGGLKNAGSQLDEDCQRCSLVGFRSTLRVGRARDSGE